MAGPSKVPVNTNRVLDCLVELEKLNQGVDLDIFKHFASELIVNEDDIKVLTQDFEEQTEPFKSQTRLAIDYREAAINVKAYIYPQMKSLATGISVAKLIFNAVRRSDPEGKISESLATLEEYYANNRGVFFSPTFFSCDLVEPSKSRIRIYFIDEIVSWARIQDMWMLGRKQTPLSTPKGLLLL